MNLINKNNLFNNILYSYQSYDPKNDPLFKIATPQVFADSTFIKDNCSICLNYFKDPIKLNFCKHLFCSKCIYKWNQYSNICPICRSEFNLKKSK